MVIGEIVSYKQDRVSVVGELSARSVLNGGGGAGAGGKSDALAAPCVFSPGGTLLAWCADSRRVHVFHCVAGDKTRGFSVPVLVPPRTNNATASHNDPLRHLSPPALVICTGMDLSAMAFAGADVHSALSSLPRTVSCLQRRRAFHSDVISGTNNGKPSDECVVLCTGHVNGRIRLWSVNCGALLLDLTDHRGAVRALCPASDGSCRLVSVSADKTLKVWDLLDDGNMFKTVCECRVPLYRCCWRPDHSQLAVCGLSTVVFVVDGRDYSVSARLRGHLHQVTACCYDGAGALLVTSSLDSTVILWDADSGVVLRVLYHLLPPPSLIFASGANGAWVLHVAITSNCRHVITVCEDSNVRVWDICGEQSTITGAPPSQRCYEADQVGGVSCVVSPMTSSLRDNELLTWCTVSDVTNVFAVGTSVRDVRFFALPRCVSPLKHLVRLTLRKLVASRHLRSLPLPPPLVLYLQYASGDL